MRISPLSPTKPREVALLTPGHRTLTVETTWGTSTYRGTQRIRQVLEQLKPFVCYVGRGVENMKLTTPASEWVMSTWRKSPISITHSLSGTRVLSLRSTLDRSLDPFSDLVRTLSWAREYGVSPGSVSSMAWQLWRASLDRSYTIGADPSVTRPAFFGGRQGIRRPAIFPDAESWDIKAAYPHAMRSGPFALSLREVSTSTHLDPERAGIARASVHVPKGMPNPPLPVRIEDGVIMYQTGRLEGSWTWRELDAARRLGCDVEPLEVWAPAREADLFSTWFDMSSTGRRLPGESSRMAKAIANSLWGQFAMTGDGRGEIHWTDDRGKNEIVTDLDPRAMPQDWTIHIASEVTSRVRTQTLLEALSVRESSPLHIDTDGVIVESGSRTPDNQGDDFGQWRRKEAMSVIDIKAPQVYRFRRPGESIWHYVASGMPTDVAFMLWEKKELKQGWTSFLSRYDVCLPSGASDDAVQIGIYLADLERCRSVA